MSNTLVLNDHLKAHDMLMEQGDDLSGIFPRTQIIGGYDAYVDDRGVTQFGEVVFDTTNMIVLGGALYTLGKIFGVTPTLHIDSLENFMPGFKLENEPALTADQIKNSEVLLFGVGTGGAGESYVDVKDVKYHEREIKDMIPFRQTANPLTSTEADKYWFSKLVNIDGSEKRAYYLKRFETDPHTRTLWKDGEGDEDGSEVGNNPHETPDSNTTPMETFIEIVLKITKKDVKEFFEDLGNVEQTRINSIGLFTAVKHKIDDAPETYDYRNVKLFSKLNINNEMLTMAKDLTIVYRIFTA